MRRNARQIMMALRESVREEAQTGLIWVALGVIGWTAISVAIDSRFFGSGLVEQIAVVAVLSLVTGFVFTLPLLGVRLVTGEDLSALRPGGPIFRLIAGALLSAFVPLYFVLAWGVSPLVLPVFGVVIAVIVWRVGLRRTE